jgi:hypothetical protein
VDDVVYCLEGVLHAYLFEMGSNIKSTMVVWLYFWIANHVTFYVD